MGYSNSLASRDISLYVHIPFCLKKCPYCNFPSFALHPVPEQEYTAVLLREIDFLVRRYALKHAKIKTIYFGGGTPSLFSPHAFEKILHNINQHFSTEENIEITLEANPETVTTAILRAYNRAGINRLNLGCQSFQDKALKTLGRIHTAERCFEAFSSAEKSGFENIGIDLIYGIPGQNIADFQKDLETVKALGATHISCYELAIEKGTAFWIDGERGNFIVSDEDTKAAMYYLCHAMLTQKGYTHYEIANFALSGFPSQHNLRYWQRKNYIGTGVGAHSFLRCIPASAPWGIRWENSSSLQEYMHGSGFLNVGKERLTKKQAMEETIFLGLRTEHGISLSAVKNSFGEDFPNRYNGFIEKLLREGFADFDGERLKLTVKGMLLSNEIFLYFFQ